MAIITNPVFASVVIMLVLCVLHVNVYLAIIIAAVICGLMGGAPLTEIISLFASGISSHGENAIIFIILAANRFRDCGKRNERRNGTSRFKNPWSASMASVGRPYHYCRSV